MGTKRLHRTRNFTRELNHAQLVHHTCGRDYFGGGYGGQPGSGIDVDEDRMKEDWETNRDQIEAYAAADPLRASWGVYSKLRFDDGLSHEEALAHRDAVAHAENDEFLRKADFLGMEPRGRIH